MDIEIIFTKGYFDKIIDQEKLENQKCPKMLVILTMNSSNVFMPSLILSRTT